MWGLVLHSRKVWVLASRGISDRIANTDFQKVTLVETVHTTRLCRSCAAQWNAQAIGKATPRLPKEFDTNIFKDGYWANSRVIRANRTSKPYTLHPKTGSSGALVLLVNYAALKRLLVISLSSSSPPFWVRLPLGEGTRTDQSCGTDQLMQCCRNQGWGRSHTWIKKAVLWCAFVIPVLGT